MVKSLLNFRICYILPVTLAVVTIEQSPANEAVMAGSSVKFKCRAKQPMGLSDYISWDELITKESGRRISNDEELVYELLGGDKDRAERYSIEHPQPGQFDLIISDVKPEDAGTYKCHSPNDLGVYRTAELIVLGGDPVCCRNTTEPDYAVVHDVIKTTCEVTYKGLGAPRMLWTEDGTALNDVIDESTKGKVKYSIKFTVTQNHHGNVYGCRTYFTPPSDTDEHAASNEPSYNYEKTFSPLEVDSIPSNRQATFRVYLPGLVFLVTASTLILMWRLTAIDHNKYFNNSPKLKK